MQYYMEEYRKYVEITGLKNIAFTKAEDFLKANRKRAAQDLDVQFFDAQLIATQEHLYFATLNALQAFKTETNISKCLAVETILYASGQRQIKKAIEHCGIRPQTKDMAVLIISERPEQIQTTLQTIKASVRAEPDERVLEITESKETRIKKDFEI